ncbi:MAG: alpha/beta hydrolase [Chloroflexota bacterium]
MNMTPYYPFRSAAAKEEYLTRYDAMADAWPVPSECRMIDTAYGQTFVRISGPVDAPPLILLHGAGGNSLQWMFNIEALSAHHRTYAVDSLINTGGVGRSVYTQAITGAEAAMDWLDELFTALDLAENINLLGGSYGGWLASHYALHAPNRLDKVVLIAPAGTVLPFRAAYMLRVIWLSLFPRHGNYLRFFRWAFRDLARQNNQFLEEMAADAFASSKSFEPVNPNQLPKLTAMSDAELQRLQQVPTLFMVGENEVLYSAQKAVERLRTVAPQVAVAFISDAGHDLLILQTATVNEKVVAFLGNRPNE